MKPFRILPSLLLATGWALHSQAGTPHDKAVPENTDFYLEMRDWRGTEKTWQASPAYTTWQSKELAPVREWFGGKWEELFEAQGDKTPPSVEKLKELTAHFQGPVSVAILDIDRMVAKLGEAIGGGAGGGAGAAPAGDGEDVSWQPVQKKNADPDAEEDEEEEFDEEDGTGGGDDFNPADLPALALLAQVEGDGAAFSKDMEALLDLLAEEAAKSDEDEKVLYKRDTFQQDGVDLRTFVGTEGKTASTNLFWAVIDGCALIGNRAETVATLAGNLRKGSAVKPLAAHPEYARAVSRLEKADALFFLNLTHLMAGVEKLMAKSTQPNPMVGFSLEQLGKRLDLTAMLPITSALKLEDEGLRMTSDFGFSRATPLSKVFMPYGRERTEMPGFVPTEAMSATAMRVSPAKWYESLEVFLNSLSPQVGMFLGMARMGITTQLGIDLKTDLLDHLGDTIVTADQITAPEAAPDKADAKKEDEEEEDEEADPLGLAGANRLIAFSLKDKAALQTTIGKVLNKMGDSADILKKKDYLGQEYFEVQPNRPNGMLAQQSFAYAFLGDHLVLSIGNPTLLQAAIRAAQKPGTSLWENQHIRKEIARGEGAPVSVQIAQTQSLVAEMAKAISMTSGGEDLPDFSLLGRLFGETIAVARFDGQRLSSDGILRYADEAK